MKSVWKAPRALKLAGAAFTVLAGAAPALAAPTPVDVMPAYQKDWSSLSVRIDLRNLTGPSDAGKLSDEELETLLDKTNRIWSQCSVRYLARSMENVSAQALKVPYQPKSTDDLSTIARALNPNGYRDAIPVTIAGPWTFYDAPSGVYLNGLGWVFTAPAPGTIDRIGAMISNLKTKDVSVGGIIAHEIAHAVSLPHVAESDNLMGPGGTNRITLGQCNQARQFIETALKPFVVPL